MNKEKPSKRSLLIPDWDIPKSIKAIVTTRIGGYSQAPWESFNFALHVGDNPHHVLKNRARLKQQLPSEPFWLEQVHGRQVVDISCLDWNKNIPPIIADGAFSRQQHKVCGVMTADCLPILVTERNASAVMALHAGWRGLADGIVEQGIKLFLQRSSCAAEDILVWFGPAIGPKAFEVGNDVREIFLSQMSCESAFTPADLKSGKWLANIYQLARLRLHRMGINNISGGHECTFNNSDLYYSYRRDGISGRMVSLIWMD